MLGDWILPESVFNDHIELLWFNPITCKAQREIRGLRLSSLHTESPSLPWDISRANSFGHFDIGSYICQTSIVVCQDKGKENTLKIGLSVRTEEMLPINEDQVNDVIQSWVSQQYFTTVTQFSWADRTHYRDRLVSGPQVMGTFQMKSVLINQLHKSYHRDNLVYVGSCCHLPSHHHSWTSKKSLLQINMFLNVYEDIISDNRGMFCLIYGSSIIASLILFIRQSKKLHDLW